MVEFRLGGGQLSGWGCAGQLCHEEPDRRLGGRRPESPAAPGWKWLSQFTTVTPALVVGTVSG